MQSLPLIHGYPSRNYIDLGLANGQSLYHGKDKKDDTNKPIYPFQYLDPEELEELDRKAYFLHSTQA